MAVRQACSRLKALSTYATVHTHAREDQIELGAFNGEIAAWHTMPATADGQAQFSLDHALFHNVIAAIPTESVVLSIPQTDTGMVEITSEDQRIAFKIKRSETVDILIPDRETISAEKTVLGRFLAKELAYMIVSTQFVLANADKHIPITTLGHLVAGDGSIFLEATDGYRLARYSAPLPSNASLDVVLPARALEAARNILVLLSSPEDMLELAYTQDHIILAKDDLMCAISIIRQEYPDTDKVVSRATRGAKTLTVEREAFADALWRAVAVASATHASTRLEMAPDAITMRTGDDPAGVSEAIPAQVSPPEPCTLAFAPRFLYEALDFIPNGKIVLAFASDREPIAICQDRWRYILMPVAPPKETDHAPST